MDLLNQFAAEQHIEVNNILINAVADDNAHLVAIHDEFLNVVADAQAVIEHPAAAVVHVGFSSGKDSNLVLIAIMEAYRRSIASGAIEPERLLLVSTIDTLIEALPMQFMVDFSKHYIAKFAKKHNINLVHTITSPTLSSEYFVKYAGADKLVNNPSRTGDCTNILKLDPAMKVLSMQRKTILDGKRVISCTGSRNEESPRRLMNMRKQGVSNKAVDTILMEMSMTELSSTINFAPIRDWPTSDVFDFLRIIGSDALYSIRDQRDPVESYFPHFALLLEIYGKASNEACSITVNVSGKTESNGCGGSSERYGCNFCTRIITDRSAISVSQKPYWDFLGTTDALRVRDWLSRTASNPDARTMHPKAVDPVFNRIMFQSNVLKPRFLEKMVKYASQLTVNAIAKASEFDDLIKQGREAEHEGYAAILSDNSIHPKAKDQLLKMYKSGARKPYMPYFSLKHATLLSMKWSLLGVSSAPYRPLKIWDDAVKGNGVIPFPKLNSELPKSEWEMKSTPMVDPIVLPVHPAEFEKTFFEEGKPLLSYWEKPFDIMDMYDHSNCRKAKKPKGTYMIKAFFSGTFNACENGISLSVDITKVADAKTGKALDFNNEWVAKSEIESLLENKVFSYLIENHGVNRFSDLSFTNKQDAEKAARELTLLVKDVESGNLSICYLNKKPLFSGIKKEPVKSIPKRNATERVRLSGKSGKVVKTSTRCKFYTPSTTPNLELKVCNFINMAVVDFNTEDESTISIRDYFDEIPSEIEPIMFNELEHLNWLDYGGYEKAIQLHDEFVESKIKYRHLQDMPRVRRYSGSEPISRLMNESGLMIEPSYKKQFEKTLKRTHLLKECGAFDLQALSFDDLTAYKGTISMEQHRSDKAAYLLKVRAKKNEQRRDIKNLAAKAKTDLPSFVVDVATKIQSDLFANAMSYIDYLDGMAIDSDGFVSGSGVDCEVPMKTQIKAFKTWFNFYGAALSSYDEFKKVFLGQDYNKALSCNRFSDLAISRAHNKLQIKLEKAVATCSHELTVDLSNMDQKSVEKNIVSNMSTNDKVSAMSDMIRAAKKNNSSGMDKKAAKINIDRKTVTNMSASDKVSAMSNVLQNLKKAS